MKALLTAIKSSLKTQVTAVRDRDVFVVEDADVLPAGAGFPAIGIKDGAISRKRVAVDLREVACTVQMICYVRLSKPEAAVMGWGTTPGVLDLADDILTALEDNYLSITGMHTAECRSEQASELYGDEKEALQRKILTFIYIKDE